MSSGEGIIKESKPCYRSSKTKLPGRYSKGPFVVVRLKGSKILL